MTTRRIDIAPVDAVIREMDTVIDYALEDGNALGIFAYVYKCTTEKIKDAIAEGIFEDNARMLAFDVAFARLYLDAFEDYMHARPVCKAWQNAFEARKANLTIIQHLLLGMNAHINLDLGIAAAQIAPGEKIQTLKRDFMLVNQILWELTDDMQRKINRVSRLMALLDWIGNRTDEKIIYFNIRKSRDLAWKLACTLAASDENTWSRHVERADTIVYDIGRHIKSPPGRILPLALRIIRLFETKNYKRVISVLEEDHA